MAVEPYDEQYFAAQLSKSDEKIAWQYGRLLDFAGILPKGARILDAGCGAGPALRYLEQRGYLPFGSDLVFYPLTQAQARAPSARLVQCNLDRALPYAEESLDLILLSEVIEHVAQPEFTLRECLRVLRSGGAVALTTPNLWDVRRTYYPLLGRVWSGDADATHQSLFSPRRLAATLRAAGFSRVQVRAGFKPVGWLSSRRLGIRKPLPGLPLVGNTLVAVGRK